jgi:hypothetical protein
VIASLSLLGSFLLGHLATGQGGPSGEHRAQAVSSPASVAVVLEGFVLAPDGSPAEGAVVVSSAGGRAVTDVAVNYRLEVEVPLDATSVQVTAVGGARGNLVARASVALSATTWARVDPLALSISSTCLMTWLPTFGERPGTTATVKALAVYDDGNGPMLYAGGDFPSSTLFTGAGGVEARGIAKWDGSRWSALPSSIFDNLHANALATTTTAAARHSTSEATSRSRAE